MRKMNKPQSTLTHSMLREAFTAADHYAPPPPVEQTLARMADNPRLCEPSERRGHVLRRVMSTGFVASATLALVSLVMASVWEAGAGWPGWSSVIAVVAVAGGVVVLMCLVVGCLVWRSASTTDVAQIMAELADVLRVIANGHHATRHREDQHR